MKLIFIVVLFSLLTQSKKVVADQELPLWEIGIGGLIFNNPDYPGSSESQSIALPFPYVIYRGEFFRADREGVRGIFFESENLELNVSLGGNLPTDDDNDARFEMPELDPLIEIGPSLEYRFYKESNSEYYFRFPIRAALSVFGEDDFIKYQGLVVNPEIFSTHKFQWFGTTIDSEFNIGPLFGLDGINQYFYDVEEQYQTVLRPLYSAESGYMGTELSADFDFDINENWRFFSSFNFLYLEGAENENSPLFEDTTNISVAIGFIYTFYTSN